MIQATKVPGPALVIDCPACGDADVPATTYRIREQDFPVIDPSAAVWSTSWVVCGACRAEMLSRWPLEDLRELRPHEVGEQLRVYIPLGSRFLAVASALLCWAPMMGLVIGIVALAVNASHRGWVRVVSGVGLLASILVHLGFVVSIILSLFSPMRGPLPIPRKSVARAPRPPLPPPSPFPARPSTPVGAASWGQFFDPDGDCRARVEGETATIEVPAAHHDMNPDIGKVNAPRILRDVSGDFDADVRVEGDFRPEAPGTRPGGSPYVGAGLLLMGDARTFLRAERAAQIRNGRAAPFLLLALRESGGPERYFGGPIPEGPITLKLSRRGDELTVKATGDDGQPFTRSIRLDWPASLKLGVLAVSTSSAPFAPRFGPLDVSSR